MRIWSVHPEYLDSKGLVALWRETLLAKNVLEGKTKGYTNHPQLIRFKESKKPLDAINFYLKHVWLEATKRNFNFDIQKFTDIKSLEQIDVTSGQMNFEILHLKRKLSNRDPERLLKVSELETFNPHPLFNLIEGDIAVWEKV